MYDDAFQVWYVNFTTVYDCISCKVCVILISIYIVHNVLQMEIFTSLPSIVRDLMPSNDIKRDLYSYLELRTLLLGYIYFKNQNKWPNYTEKLSVIMYIQIIFAKHPGTLWDHSLFTIYNVIITYNPCIKYLIMFLNDYLQQECIT